MCLNYTNKLLEQANQKPIQVQAPSGLNIDNIVFITTQEIAAMISPRAALVKIFLAFPLLSVLPPEATIRTPA